MKNTSPRMVIAGWLLVAAFAANGWLQFLSYYYLDDVFGHLLSLLQSFASNRYAAIEILQVLSAMVFSWIGLIGGVLTLIFRRKIFAIGGAAFFIVQFPIDFIWMATTSGMPIGEVIKSMFDWGPAYSLGNVGNLLAVIALVIALTDKVNRTSLPGETLDFEAEVSSPVESGQAPAAQQKPVAYDTQTGRAILGYNTKTGQPIFADEQGAAQ